jgi:hypothetical protein
MFTAHSLQRPLRLLTLLYLTALSGSPAARAQDEDPPKAPSQGLPLPCHAPDLKKSFGVLVGNYDNGRVRGAIVVSVEQGSPATRVRVKRRKPDGNVVYGPPTTMIPGDIITGLVAKGAGQKKGSKPVRIQTALDLVQAIQDLPGGAEFEIGGYDAGNSYRRFTAAAKLGGRAEPDEDKGSGQAQDAEDNGKNWAVVGLANNTSETIEIR